MIKKNHLYQKNNIIKSVLCFLKNGVHYAKEIIK